jgi:hypothetical protein
MSENGTEDQLWHVVNKLDDMARDHMHWMQENVVADGSAIDEDDRQFTIISMRQLVDSSVKAALDCIYLACASLLDQERVRGVGHPALARSAITAGTTALWLLAADVQTRRTRTLQLARAQCLAEHVYVDGYPSDNDKSVIDEFTATRKKRENGVIADGKRLGIEESAVKAKPRDGDIVRDGAARIPDSLLGGRPSAATVLSEWRLLSGWAHGFLWPVRYTSRREQREEDERFETYKIAMTLDRYLGSIRIAFTTVRVAIDRFAPLAGINPPPLPAPWDDSHFA